jgi:photosystem II stability/assembly factor-like uncharacterized protein
MLSLDVFAMKSIRRVAFMLGLAAGSASAETAFWPQWSDLGVTLVNGAATGGTDAAVILAVRPGNAPLRSLDGGRTFTPFSVMGIQPQAIIGAPANPSVFYALSAQPRVPSEAPPHLFRSDDAGATWREVFGQLGLANGWIGDIVVGDDPNVLYGERMVASICFTGLCSFSGEEPYRSIDGGITWQAIGSGVTGYEQMVRPALSSGGRTLYVGSKDGVFRSLDAGASWQRVRTDPYVREVAVDRIDPATAYARAGDDAQLWVTEDSGETWRAAAPLDVPGTGSGHAAHVLADPLVAGRVFYVGDEGHVFESTDRARTWTRVAGTSGSLFARTIAISAQGDSRFLLTVDGTVRRLELRPGSYFLGSDLWWNPAEAGRGWTITQHANGKAFVAWYAYDTQGKQVWRVMPDGAWQDARTLAGTVYETRGPAYFQGTFDPHGVSVQATGTATLHFDSGKSASFSYALNDGTQGTIAIVREAFGTPYLFRIGDYADMWWNPAESGWGIAVSQQYSKVFAAWYVYDAAGHPQWVVMPDSTFTYDYTNGYAATFRGDIYTTSGPPSTGPFDPARVTVTKVGSASIAFSSRTEGSIRYDAFGVSATRPLSRQPF